MATDMFLKFTPELKGEAIDLGNPSHKDEIVILAWSWGESNAGSAHHSSGAGTGKVSVNDINVTKFVDLSSGTLWTMCAKGKHFTKATLTVRKATGDDTPLEYLTINMDEVFITSVSTGGSGGEEQLTENVTMSFAKVKLKYTQQSSTGAKGGTSEFNWDIRANGEYK